MAYPEIEETCFQKLRKYLNKNVIAIYTKHPGETDEKRMAIYGEMSTFGEEGGIHGSFTVKSLYKVNTEIVLKCRADKGENRLEEFYSMDESCFSEAIYSLKQIDEEFTACE